MCVTIGISGECALLTRFRLRRADSISSLAVAFIAAYLPPKVTQKGTVRRTYSKVIGQLGSVTCQVLSFANLKDDGAKAPRQIIANLTTLRAKVCTPPSTPDHQTDLLLACRSPRRTRARE